MHAVVLTGGLDKVFCAGANIQMLASSTHGHKVNFCKFTNETRNGIEDATAHSGQVWIAAVNGTAAGGGYELALACDEILLVDDRASAVSLPELPLLAVLPGTGGLPAWSTSATCDATSPTCSPPGPGRQGPPGPRLGLGGRRRATELVRRSGAHPGLRRAGTSDRPAGGSGIALTPLRRAVDADGLRYDHVEVAIDRALGAARFTVHGPSGEQPATGDDLAAAGAEAWVLATARQLDDAILHLRFNEPEIGTWILCTQGDGDAVAAAESVLEEAHWLARETRLFWARTLKRLDVSARTLVALVEPGACSTGTLAELALAADRTYMLDGTWEGSDTPAPVLKVTAANDGWYPMSNGLTRLATRFWGRDDALGRAREQIGKDLSDGRGPRRRADHLRLRRPRLGGRGPAAARGAQQLLARRPHGPGGEQPLRRARDDGDEDLRPAVGLAELDLPAAERRRTRRRPAPLRHAVPARPSTREGVS